MTVYAVLHMLSPLFAAANLLALTLLAWECRREIRAVLPSGTKPLWFAAALMAAQLAVYIFLAGKKHLVYIDEFWYMEAAKNIFLKGWAPDFDKSAGWPAIISLSYAIGGIDNFSAIWASIILGMAAPLAAGAAAYLALGSAASAALAALLMAALPHAIIWSASAETGAPSLFFVCAAAFFSLVYYRKGGVKPLWLALCGWSMAAQIRPENMLFLTLFAAGIWLEKPPRLSLPKFLAPWLCALAANLPNFLIYAKFQNSEDWITRESGGAIAGSNFSAANLLHNAARWGGALFDGRLHPPALTMAFLAGAVWLALKRPKTALWLALWLLLPQLFYFSAWFDTYGSTTALFPKTKLFLQLYPPYIIAAACGFMLPFAVRKYRWLSVFAAAWLVAGMGPYYTRFSPRNDAQELEAKIISDFKNRVPANCAIIANAPVIINSVNSYTTVYTGAFLESAELRRNVLQSPCALYFRDITRNLTGQPFARMDARMRESFELRPEFEFRHGGAEMSLCRIFPRAPAGRK
ncbi:MAG: glycosyltransferase family 39 protein [Elusimicrobiales bacterium]